jgi:hypothetical protein
MKEKKTWTHTYKEEHIDAVKKTDTSVTGALTM